MTDLFDKSDVLTVITAEQAKVGDRGYFGNSLLDLQEAIKNNYLASIATIFTGRCDCFMNNVENTIYGLFLPLDKVKNKEPTYRPLKNIDELFSFLVPSIAKAKDSYTTLDKVGIILCTVLELKGKHTGFTYYRQFSRICVTNKDLRLDDCTLDYIFETYEIKKDGEWVPFGIKEE